MNLNLYNINYYFLTCDNQIRKNHMIKEFENFKLTEVNPVKMKDRVKSGITGFSKILDLACKNQDKSKPFEPFVILEDDVKKKSEFPQEIEIPEDTDIFYIGLSIYGMGNKNGEFNIVSFKNIDENIIRIYNMLSTHGMIICSIRGLLTLQKCILEDYFRNRKYDMSLSQIQPYINVYALKNPLVYQYSKIGGHEKPTNINYMNKKDKLNHIKVKDNFSIITLI